MWMDRITGASIRGWLRFTDHHGIVFTWVLLYFRDGVSKVPTASHDNYGDERMPRCSSRVEVRSYS